jgi:hypothetical protein
LECTSSTHHRAHPRDRRPDPFKCVKKYRRSAAGGGVNVNVNDNDKHESRSILDLEISADYLIGRIFANQQSDHDGMEESVSPTSTSTSTSTSTCCQYQLSLAQTANFVDDRLRAVQVDLTTLLGRMEMEQMDRHEHAGTSISGSTSGSGSISGNDISSISSTVRTIQVKLIRYNILAQHMLSGLGSDRYQWSFAQKALTTAISSYFATFHGTGHAHGTGHVTGHGTGHVTGHGTGHGTGHAHAHGTGHAHAHAQQPENMGYQKDLDEIMSYAALLHIATLVKKNEMALPQTSSTGQQCGLALDGGTGISAILGLYKRYVNENVNVDVDVDVNVNHVTSTTDSERSDRERSDSDSDRSDLSHSYPKYQWALQVASAIENGEFLSALRLLRPPMSTSTSMSMSTSTTSIGIRTKETSQWEIMSRCCVAQVVPLLRIGLLRRYNKSYGKNEKVADTDVSVYIYICVFSDE